MSELGLKHVRYGVRPAMFPVFGDCLVETLEEVLGGDMTPSVRKAWVDTYKVLSGFMVNAQLKAQPGKRSTV